MRVTVFSLVMSVLWGSFLIVLIHFCRRKPVFVRKMGIRSLLALYLICAVRMLIPCEFSFARVIPLRAVFGGQGIGVRQAGEGRSSFGMILAVVWAGAACILMVRFFCHYLSAMRRFSRYGVCKKPEYQRILQQVMNESRSRMAVTVRSSSQVSVPMGIGIFKKSILLPEEEYSDSELYYILLHEYTHFRNRDLLIKILVHMFGCVYWWNPAVYLLKKDLAQILEIRCDITVTDEMGDRDKATYLATIVSVLKHAGARRQAKAFYGATALVAESYEPETVERFRIVSAASRDRKKYLLFTASWFLALFTLLYSSYVFTVRPGYLAPGTIHVTETEPGIYDVQVEETFVDIMKHTKTAYTYLRGRR